MFEYFPNNYPWSLAVMGAISRGGMIGEIDEACRPLKEFAGRKNDPAAQVAWVALGSSGFQALGLDTYGDGSPKDVTSGMPSWGDSLTADELMEVVLHERSGLNDEEFDIEVWKEGFEETLSDFLPADKVAGYVAVLEEWESNPPEPAA